MSDTERYGRILLAAAVLALFLVVVASMVVGEFILPLFMLVIAVGLVGYVLMRAGQQRG